MRRSMSEAFLVCTSVVVVSSWRYSCICLLWNGSARQSSNNEQSVLQGLLEKKQSELAELYNQFRPEPSHSNQVPIARFEEFLREVCHPLISWILLGIHALYYFRRRLQEDHADTHVFLFTDVIEWTGSASWRPSRSTEWVGLGWRWLGGENSFRFSVSDLRTFLSVPWLIFFPDSFPPPPLFFCFGWGSGCQRINLGFIFLFFVPLPHSFFYGFFVVVVRE